MTNEQALEILKQPGRIGCNLIKANDEESCKFNQESIEALDMAIKALEQPTSDDCVSRQAVLDCLTATGLKKFDFILDAREKVNNLPPVKPTRKVVKNGKIIKRCN